MTVFISETEFEDPIRFVPGECELLDIQVAARHL
jgi:hypothetical protein